MRLPSHKLSIAGLIALALGLIVLAYFHFFVPGAVPQDTVEVEESAPTTEIVGASVEGRDITAYTYGEGDTHLLFVGGIHGGYEWNSVLLSYRLIDYLAADADVLPENLMVSVIPSANPDGLYVVTGTEGRFTMLDVPQEKNISGAGRFNARGVDLNRNFDCKWAPTSSWRGNTVSAGTEPFSEPEARAIRDFVHAENPDAVIFFHSQANTVYASECEEGVLPQTSTIMNLYARAAGYNAVESFDAYPITGDAEGWLASIGIPAITVELRTHETVEWQQNLRGIQALFEYYKD